MIWQTKTWWEMLVSSGQAEEIFEIPHPNPLLQGEGIKSIFIEKRKVAMGEYWLFALGITSPLTPLLQGEGDKLIELCKRERCLFIQVETLDYNPPSSEDNSVPLNKGEWAKRKGDFREWYYKKFITPYTAVIDLEKSEEEILAAMKPKGRYNIRLAEKKWVKCEMVEKSDWHIEKFYNLMNETTSRDKFSGHSFEYFKTFLTSLENSELMLAYYEDQIIAGGIFVFDEDVSIYYYGASGNAHRNLMAPYLLQWSAIKIAKSRRSKLYDFLGVATPGSENDPLAGVTSFKKKLTKDIREVSSSSIYVNKKLKYNLIKLLKNFT